MTNPIQTSATLLRLYQLTATGYRNDGHKLFEQGHMVRSDLMLDAANSAQRIVDTLRWDVMQALRG